jgi:hypothetical protein
VTFLKIFGQHIAQMPQALYCSVGMLSYVIPWTDFPPEIRLPMLT